MNLTTPEKGLPQGIHPGGSRGLMTEPKPTREVDLQTQYLPLLGLALSSWVAQDAWGSTGASLPCSSRENEGKGSILTGMGFCKKNQK